MDNVKLQNDLATQFLDSGQLMYMYNLYNLQQAQGFNPSVSTSQFLYTAVLNLLNKESKK